MGLRELVIAPQNDDPGDAISGLLGGLMFPYTDEHPSRAGESLFCPPIPCDVVRDLYAPIGRVRAGLHSVFGASVPEAAVNRDRDALPGKCHVDDVAKVRDGAKVLPKAKTESMKLGSEREFRPSVLSTVPTHDCRCGGR